MFRGDIRWFCVSFNEGKVFTRFKKAKIRTLNKEDFVLEALKHLNSQFVITVDSFKSVGFEFMSESSSFPVISGSFCEEIGEEDRRCMRGADINDEKSQK